MLRIIEGGFFSGAHELINKEIKELVDKKKRAFLIVPEQQTVIAEAELSEKLCDSAPLYFEVTNFTRLANTVFRSLGGEELATLVRLVKLFAISAVTLSSTQTLSACLTPLGRPMRSAVAMFLAMSLKTALNVALLQNPSLSIYGAAIAANGGYTLSLALNFFSAMRATRARKRKTSVKAA